MNLRPRSLDANAAILGGVDADVSD